MMLHKTNNIAAKLHLHNNSATQNKQYRNETMLLHKTKTISKQNNVATPNKNNIET